MRFCDPRLGLPLFAVPARARQAAAEPTQHGIDFDEGVRASIEHPGTRETAACSRGSVKQPQLTGAAVGLGIQAASAAAPSAACAAAAPRAPLASRSSPNAKVSAA